MRRWIIVLILLFVILLVWVRRPWKPSGEMAYIGELTATLWSSAAQVREPVAILRYGEQVAVLQRRGKLAEVRSSAGKRGWVESHLLLEPELWQRRAQLVEQARTMPVQARGHTKVVSNVRVEPGRDAPRLYQFGRGMPVEVFSRAVAASSPLAEGSAGAVREASPEEQKPRLEDWLLVRGEASGAAKDSIPVVGWVLGRFVGLELPGPVRDYASSSGMRVVAWFELNRVPDEEGEKPQYLAVGTRGGEGQPCDFTVLRVYTWGAKRQRYETAYGESDFCGRLPVRVVKSASRDPEFRFRAASKAGEEERVYGMRQTLVRRVREAGKR